MEIICSCFGISKEDIQDAIASGLTTVDEVAEETGASHGCGRCSQEFEDVTKELLSEN
ncbi:(2Fe-2S)-binding protein [Halosquirtibacter xylanolyticus]|uniref:(2Fe-2S)-binding protein n=1 Tax=Halosquirtibacter xylanolyticus TaxID=3374599 RepID=UPI0037499D9E|nr:(2Fe-2S)-binding protein [Prolixibacteraceae bacterium]